MSNDPNRCPSCGALTARFDPVLRRWACALCGWREGGPRICPAGRFWGLAAALLLVGPLLTAAGPCTILWHERIPFDAGAQWEGRVKVCTIANEPFVIIETLEYERTQSRDGSFRYRQATDQPEFTELQDGWWREARRVRLYLTTTPPPMPGQPTRQDYP